MRNLSVIVPVYNTEKYIHQCVDSLLAQDYSDMEILLIDDGSPDHCPQICDMYAKKDSRIRVIHQENKGIAETRNIGIREANAKYIAFLDSDDYILPGMFSNMMKYFGMDERTDIVICDWNTFYDGKEDKLIAHHQNINPVWTTEKIRDEFLFDHYPNYTWNKIYRKELFNGVTIPAGIPYEDLLIMAPLMARAKKIVYVPEVYLCYRMHASSFSMTPKIKKKLGMYLAWREHEQVCEEYGCLEPFVYCKMRAQKSAISLKMIDLAAHYLTKKQLEELDAYLEKMKSDTSLLSTKHKLELWSLQYLPNSFCAFGGKMSIWMEEYKQYKIKKAEKVK